MSMIQREDRNSSINETLKGARILLAEDDEHIKGVLTFILEENGAIVDTVETGLESMLNAIKGNYHVVLMDLNLPVMDGETAVRKMRSSGYMGPVLALSAQDERVKRQSCIENGFDDYLTKPFQLDDLIGKLIHWKNAGSANDQRVIH